MLLSGYGIQIGDYQLIKNSFVPYMIKLNKEQSQILAAFQIQDKTTFNRIVNKYNLRFSDIECSDWEDFKKEADQLLKNNHPFMIGINPECIFGENKDKAFPTKHTAIIEERINDSYKILNPVRKESEFENKRQIIFREQEFKVIIESIQDKPFRLGYISKPDIIENINYENIIEDVKQESLQAIEYTKKVLQNISIPALTYGKYMALISNFIKPLANDLRSSLLTLSEGKEIWRTLVELLSDFKKVAIEIQQKLKAGLNFKVEIRNLQHIYEEFSDLYKELLINL